MDSLAPPARLRSQVQAMPLRSYRMWAGVAIRAQTVKRSKRRGRAFTVHRRGAGPDLRFRSRKRDRPN
jgi:hypothetical protein